MFVFIIAILVILGIILFTMFAGKEKAKGNNPSEELSEHR